MSGFAHVRKVSLSHTISRLILIRIKKDCKGDKVIPYNADAFSGFELEIIGQDRREPNHFIYIFGGISIN